jgi:hypothetical protein
MKQNSLLKIALMGTLALGATGVKATTLNIDGNVLMGINGVLVGTKTYNVAFGDTGTNVTVARTFVTAAEAETASLALGLLLDVNGDAGSYGDGGGGGIGKRTINGIDVWSNMYWIYTHYGLANTGDSAKMAYDYRGTDTRRRDNGWFGTNSWWGLYPLTEQDMRQNVNATNAVWTEVEAASVSTIPEPTSMVLLGLGALGFAASRKKSKHSDMLHQPDTMSTTA